MVHCLSRETVLPETPAEKFSLWARRMDVPRDEMGWTGPFWLGRPCGTSWACRRALSQARHPDPPGTETNPLEGDTHEETIGKQAGWRWLLLLALCVGIVGAIFFLPHPVVQNVAETSIQGLQYQPQYGQEDGTLAPPTTLTDYDQAAVLACLSRYQEQRTLEKADGQEEDAGRFTMVLDVNGETKQLVLGEECYSYGRRWNTASKTETASSRTWGNC